jgi:hypothetical protein
MTKSKLSIECLVEFNQVFFGPNFNTGRKKQIFLLMDEQYPPHGICRGSARNV